MFWPFTKWATAPAPYDQRASSWPIAPQLAQMPFDAYRTSLYPAREGLVKQILAQGNGAQPRVFLPGRPASARSGVATSAAVALTREERRIADLASSALEKHTRGLAVSQAEAHALLQARLPKQVGPVVPPTGIYSVPTPARPPNPSDVIARLLPQGAPATNPAAQIARVVSRVANQAVIPQIARRMMR